MLALKIIVGVFALFYGLGSLIVICALFESFFGKEKLPIQSLPGYAFSIAIWTAFACCIYALFFDWSAAVYAFAGIGIIICMCWSFLIAMFIQHYRAETTQRLVAQTLGEDGALPELVELFQFVQKSDLGARKMRLSGTTATFKRFSHEFDIDQLYVFDRMLCMLARSVDVGSRAELACALIEHEHAPMGVIRMLAYDQDIRVSEPILRASKWIDDSDLISLAKAGTARQAHAISMRPALSAAVAEILAARFASQSSVLSVTEHGASGDDFPPLPSMFLPILIWCTIVTSVQIILSTLELPPESRILAYVGAAFCLLILGAYLNRKLLKRVELRRAVFNRKTYSLGWELLLISACLIIVALGRFVMFLFWDYFYDASEMFFWILTGGLALAVMHWGNLLAVRRWFTPLATDARMRDTRPPVLYLRAFDRELQGQSLRDKLKRPWTGLTDLGRIARILVTTFGDERRADAALSKTFNEIVDRNAISGALSFSNIGQSLSSGRGGVYDEQLVIANFMNRIGPYVAIGRPTETFNWTDVGAAKMYVEDAIWQPTVLRLIAESAAIVIEGDASRGLTWEIQQVVSRCRPTKIMLILPDNDGDYDELLTEIGGLFPLGLPKGRPLSRLLMFSDTWLPIPLRTPTLEDQPDDMTHNSLKIALQPFTRFNGFELSRSRLLADRIQEFLRLHFHD